MSTDPDQLEKNVSTLLESGGEAPRIAPAARTRIKDHLLARYGQDAPVTPAWRRPRTLAFVGGALAAAAIVAVWLVARPGGGGPDAAEPGAPALALADGTSIVRQSGAEVTVVGPRHVRVSGAALLDVAPGQGTFVVDTARGRIEVLGTRFLVDAQPEQTTAAVVRGEVRLVSDGGDVVLHAGEQGVAEPGKAPVRAPAPRLSHLASWAQAARRQIEHAPAVHHGTLFARFPNTFGGPGQDEQPLPLAKLIVDVVVDHQVARVALDQTFHNPTAAELEGVYRFAIPPDAALQRLAMYVDGRLTESAVVERMAARRIYEEQVYHRVDPALLEWAGAGRLALRVYPLHAAQDKRLMLAYTQSLPKLYDDWTLTVPLPEVDAPIGELGFHVRVAGCANCEVTSPSHAITVSRTGADAIVTYTQSQARTGDSLVLRVRDPRRGVSVASERVGGDQYLLVRAPVELGARAADYRPRTWVILDDVSASRDAMARRAQADLIDNVLRELDENDRVAVLPFDVSARVALPMTRVMDVRRDAVRQALASEGDVGATDLGVAIDAALAQLGGVAGDDAMIMYLGDGVRTSGALHLDELTAKLVGRAHFIGVGVGDGADTQTLAALAGATGGYATTIDLADDVSWRAFDLIAALHTARVTGLGARLIDGAGAPLTATVYSPGQLADGEELELVAKLSGGAAAAVALTGTMDGQSWERRIVIPPASGTGAAYLPRMWAARHVAARLLAKHDPVVIPPCPPRAASPCMTEAAARDARDEVIRREVVELGKRYFLLTRHTSLLVLENDAMYAQYGVTKGGGDTWAPYAMPAQIPTGPAAPVAPVAPIADDAELVRARLPLFYSYGAYGPYGVSDGVTELTELNEQTVVTASQGAFDLGGLGSVRATKAVGVGGGRSSDSQASEGIRNYYAGPLASPLGGDQAEDKTGTQPQASAVAEPTEVAGHFAPATVPVVDEKPAQDRVTDLETRRASVAVTGTDKAYGPAGWGGELSGMAVTPMRYRAPDDPAFDDLTAFVPALFPDAADAWRLALGPASPDGAPHPIDDVARARLAAARARLAVGVYRWGESEIAVDAARRLGWHRTSEVDLAETAAYDGTTWTRRYAELGLAAVRSVTTDDVALGLGYLPIWIATPEHWARYFTVRARGDHEVTLARGDRIAYALTFDSDAHLVAVHDGAGRELVNVTWAGDAPMSARVAGAPVAVGFTSAAIADAVAWGHGGASDAVVIELPLRAVGFWAARRAVAPVGSEAWRRATRQHMAALAAGQSSGPLLTDLREMVAHGGVELGDLVLASSGIAAGASTAERAALPPGPVSRYLQSGYDGARALAAEPGHLGALAALRAADRDLADGRGAVAAERIVKLGDRAPLLRVLGAAMLTAWGAAPEAQVRAWDSITAGPYHNIARAQAAWAMQRAGRTDVAVERFAALAADYDLDARPVSLAAARYAFQSSRRGAAGWELASAQLRARVLASSSFVHVIALIANGELDRDRLKALQRAAELAEVDPDRVTVVAQLAVAVGELEWAGAYVQPMLATAPSRGLAQLAGRIALRQGHLAPALAALEQAQTLGAASDDDARPLRVMRAEFAELIDVAHRLAAASTGPARADAVARALRWGQRWRAVDPNNAQADMALGDLMLAVGDPSAAWRQLSTMIERDPMSGAGYEAVAGVFEREGKVAEALPYWEQALRIDQTDPTPRLRKAQALFALGRTGEGKAVLREIVSRRWHERWESVVEAARDLLGGG